jgi:hypothetical protein
VDRESTLKEYCNFTEVVKLTKLFMDNKRELKAFDGHKYVEMDVDDEFEED